MTSKERQFVEHQMRKRERAEWTALIEAEHNEAVRMRKAAETILFAPYAGPAAPYMRQSACIELGHPKIPDHDFCLCESMRGKK